MKKPNGFDRPQAAVVFKALSGAQRLQALEIIARGRRKGDACRDAARPKDVPANAVCVCEILEEMKLAAPTLSHHLKELRNAGLVTAFPRGRWSYYAADDAALAGLSDYIDRLRVSGETIKGKGLKARGKKDARPSGGKARSGGKS